MKHDNVPQWNLCEQRIKVIKVQNLFRAVSNSPREFKTRDANHLICLVGSVQRFITFSTIGSVFWNSCGFGSVRRFNRDQSIYYVFVIFIFESVNLTKYGN